MSPDHHLLRVCALLALLCCMPSQARGQAIFFEPCQNFIPLFQPETLHLWVCVEGQIATGITSAQFRIDGLPQDWIATASAKPPYALTGNLFGTGATISLNGCAQGMLWLEIGTIEVTPTTSAQDVLLSATSVEPGLPPPLDCPLVTLCDDPAFTKVCCGGYGAWINGGSCPLAVETSNWAQVKGLYR
jgi:hypothetical protein